MPIYEYQCQKCQARTEVMQKVADKPLAKCPKCGGRLEKLLSVPAIQFKGSGWYVTDYAGKKSEKRSESREEKSSGSEAAASDKATSKETSSSKKSSKPKTAPSSGD